jgi:heparan-alpha-glucosaminide N-acetyltransferase
MTNNSPPEPQGAPVRSSRDGEGDGAAGIQRSTPTARIASLDLVRGIMLVVSVAVNSLLAAPEWFDHAPWDSVHPVDVVFPLFVTLSGCGLAFALHRRVQIAPLLRRVVILLVAGLLYNAIVLNTWDLDLWRLTGVLQLYAVVVAVLGVLHLVSRSWVGWAVITVVFAAGHTGLLAIYAGGCPGGLLTPGCNPAGPLDIAVFGADHVYRLGLAGHDPEGLVAIFGALVSASLGACIGHVMLAARDRGRRTGTDVRAAVAPMLAVAVAALVLGQAAAHLPVLLGGTELPAMKRLWTAPFALRVGAGAAVALLIGHLLLDRQRIGRARDVSDVVSYPFIALGRNSLLVYFGSHVIMSVLSRPTPSGSTLAADIASAAALGGHAQATWTALLLVFWIALATVLHRFSLYLRP